MARLKMRREHFNALKSQIESVDTPERREKYINGDFPRAHLTKDLDKRYRWDLFYLTGLNNMTLWEYLNDDHIDSALRQIVKPL